MASTARQSPSAPPTHPLGGATAPSSPDSHGSPVRSPAPRRACRSPRSGLYDSGALQRTLREDNAGREVVHLQGKAVLLGSVFHDNRRIIMECWNIPVGGISGIFHVCRLPIQMRRGVSAGRSAGASGQGQALGRRRSRQWRCGRWRAGIIQAINEWILRQVSEWTFDNARRTGYIGVWERGKKNGEMG